MEKLFVSMIIIGILLGVIGSILVAEGFRLRDIEIKTMIGEIIPFEIDLQEPFEVNFGNNYLSTTVTQLSEGINPRKIIGYAGYDYPVNMIFKDRKLLVSAEIKNREGETIAKIKDNHWVVHENKILARDRNYNAYAFEVIDSDLIPVLQVVLRDQNRIYIGGLFYFETGRVLATQNGVLINPSPDQISEDVEAIFRYPSDEHLGEMTTMWKLENPIETVRKSTWFILPGGIIAAFGGILAFFGGYELNKEEKKKRKSKKSRIRKKKRKSPN